MAFIWYIWAGGSYAWGCAVRACCGGVGWVSAGLGGTAIGFVAGEWGTVWYVFIAAGVCARSSRICVRIKSAVEVAPCFLLGALEAMGVSEVREGDAVRET